MTWRPHRPEPPHGTFLAYAFVVSSDRRRPGGRGAGGKYARTPRMQLPAPLRLLLIDDDPQGRELALEELRRELPDLAVREVADAEGLASALGALGGGEDLDGGGFDLIVTEHRLGWTDGLAVLRAVKARQPGLPVILFTGSPNVEVAVEAMKDGAADYVSKAVDRAGLAAG